MAAEYGQDAVLYHARQGDIAEVKRLVSVDRAMANYTHVVTPLMWASYMGHMQLATYLLHHGARVNQVEAGKGRTALYLAAGRGHADMVDLLLKWGADPCIRRSGGWDALSVAASEAHVEVVSLLLDVAGVEVDGSDADGCTALHRASAWGRAEVVRVLLQHGADWRRRTQGKTPLDMARDRGRVECAALLEDAERLYVLRRTRFLRQHALAAPMHYRDAPPCLRTRLYAQPRSLVPEVALPAEDTFGKQVGVLGKLWRLARVLAGDTSGLDAVFSARDAQQQEVLAATAAYVVSDMKFDVLLQLVDLLR